MDLKRNKKTYTILLIVSFLIVLVIQLWKAQTGMGLKDEHFYAAVGYRIWQGDALLYDEWWMAQLMGFFVFPLVGIWQSLVGNNDGIVLVFRIVYIVWTLLIGYGIYRIFQTKYHITIAYLAAMAFVCFVPFNLMSLSYNTMGLLFFISALLLFDIENEKTVSLFLSGFFYGCAVINSPYLALGYFVLLALVLMKKLSLHKKGFLVFTLGITIIACIFIAFLVSRASISELMIGLKHVVDPTHDDPKWLQFAKNMGRFVLAYHIFSILFVFELGYTWYLKKKQRSMQKWNFVCLGIHALALLWIIVIHPYHWNLGGHSLALFPFAWFGVLLLIQNGADTYQKLVFGASFFYAAILSITSNVGPVSFCNPLIVASIMSLTLFETATLPYKKQLVVVLPLLLLLIRLFGYYGDPVQRDERIQVGPCKGLVDSTENVADYMQVYMDIQKMNKLGKGYGMFVTNNTWAQLVSTRKLGNDATYIYFWNQEEYTHYQDEYFSIHTDKVPLFIYLDEDNPYDMKETDPWLQQFTFVEKLEHGTVFLRNQ